MRHGSSSNVKALVTVLFVSQLLMPIATAMAATVHLDGQPVLEVSGTGGLSASRRAEVMQTNLDNAIVASYGKGDIPVNITYVKGMPVLTVGGYYIGTIDAASAKNEGTTVADLAQRWASQLRELLNDSNSMHAYVAQLKKTDATTFETVPITLSATMLSPIPETTPDYRRRKLANIPAGLKLSVSLLTTISSKTAQPGDVVEARLDEPLALGDATLPEGTVVRGRVIETNPADRLPVGALPELPIAFDTLRLPDGWTAPISGRIIGGITGGRVLPGVVLIPSGQQLEVQIDAPTSVAVTGAGTM